MFRSLLESLSKFQILFFLSSLEIKYKYTRTSLGALWNTLAAGIFIFIVTSVYSYVLSEDNSNLFLYSSIGYIFWLLCSTVILESTRLILDNESILKDMKVNILDLILRGLIKNLIIFFHNSIIIFIAMLIYSEGVSLFNLLIFFINFFLLTAILFFLSIAIAFLGLIYRDFIQLVNTSIFLFFLITPIFWTTKNAINSIYVKFNPFYYIIEIVRGPLLNQDYNLYNFYVALIILFCSIMLASIFFKKNKQIFYLF